MTHTPGKWTINGVEVLVEGEPNPKDNILGLKITVVSQEYADLLEALEGLLAGYDERGDVDEWWMPFPEKVKVARAAIAKAKGEQA